jgi:glycosyltransferase involved in cell wall biosynthesis
MLYFENHKLVDFFRNASKFRQNHHVAKDLVVSHRSFSVCTVCMNRLHDLQETLPRNLKDNSDYEEAEFVLLDYGSTDGLAEWVKDCLPDYLRSGRLAYHRVEQPYFRPCHSYNMAFRLAKNEVIAKLDADNFTGPGYLTRLNQLASLGDKTIMVPETFLRVPNRMLLRGRFAIFKHDLVALGGYDEDMDRGFGFDDVSFVFRAMLAGYKMARFEKEFVMNRIETSDADRTKLIDIDIRSSNMKIAIEKFAKFQLVANEGREWGC